jgi:hypothetical protein
MVQFKGLWSSARNFRQKHGFWALVRIGAVLAISPVFALERFYLVERAVKTVYGPADPPQNANTKDFAFFVVSSNEEADKLEKEGYVFRSIHTIWNEGEGSYKRWLNRGAVALCTFVGKEFGAINWVIMSPEVQERITYPVKVDYANHEVITRGYWVNPRFRGQGLITYTVLNRDIFLTKAGVKVTKGPVGYANKTGYGLSHSLGSRIYGKARLIRILGVKFWKETYNP